MIATGDTSLERRNRYLMLAAKAEKTAATLTDPKAKEAWIELTVSWMMMASEISQNEPSGKRLCSGAPYWRPLTQTV